jgi:hypothetical protein
MTPMMVTISMMAMMTLIPMMGVRMMSIMLRIMIGLHHHHRLWVMRRIMMTRLR